MLATDFLFETSLQHYVFLGLMLFSIGLLVVLTKQNFIFMLMGIELMLNGVNVIAISFSHYANNSSGQVIIFFILTVAAAEVGVGLALAVSMFKTFKSTSINKIEQMKD
jgi:NADH-quinone oxidoreductase subunit K